MLYAIVLLAPYTTSCTNGPAVPELVLCYLVLHIWPITHESQIARPSKILQQSSTNPDHTCSRSPSSQSSPSFPRTSTPFPSHKMAHSSTASAASDPPPRTKSADAQAARPESACREGREDAAAAHAESSDASLISRTARTRDVGAVGELLYTVHGHT